MPVPDVSRPARVDARAYSTIATSTALVITAFTVPADKIYRVRTVTAYNPTGLSWTVGINIVRSATSWSMITAITLPTVNQVTMLSGDDALYLEPGDTLQLKTNVTTTNTIHFFVAYEEIS